MYNFSNEAKKRIINGKITRAYLKVLATDTLPEIIIDESNYLKDFTFEDFRYVPDEGFIGGTVAKSITGNFNNIDNSFSIQDREFELYLGVDLEDETTEYIKYGTFIVQKPEDDQVTDNTSFEALDYMIKLNLPWEDRMTYPCTLKQLFNDLVEQSGLKTKVTTFLNEDFIVENNQFEEGTTRRDVLKAIAQVAFNWARIDEDDDIVMDFEIKNNVEETLNPDNYFNLTKQDIYGPVNVIVLRNSQVEGENVTIKDEESINAGRGKNKFNKDNMNYTKGYYLDKNGNEVANEKWQYTDYIKVDSYDVTLSEVADELPAICGYDENKKFIAGKSYNNQSYVTLSSDKKIKYIRFSVNVDWLVFRYNYHTLNFPIFIGEYPYIGKMQLEEGKEKTEYEAFVANGEIELVISDNPFAYTQSKRAELIEAGRSLFGLKYTPMSMDMIGYMYLNCKDKISTINLNNEEFETYLFNHTIEYNGVVTDSMESPASTKTETKYQFLAPIMQALKHTELLVDKANQKINAIIENVSENTEKITKLELTVDGITQTVSNVEIKIEQVEDKADNAQNTADNINNNLIQNYYTKTQTNSQIQQTADTINQTISQNISRLDQLEGEYEEQSSILVQISASLDGITQTVEDIENITNIIEGDTIIELNNCVEGSLLELHIYGNNTVFDSLYISDDLFISDDLVIYGDSRIEVTNTTNEENITEIYELGISEVLRKNGDIYDEYILSNNEAKIIRRINKDGTIKEKPEEEIIGKYSISLLEGNNIIRIQNYNAIIKAKFAIRNTYTDIFATKVEMKSSITQTAEEINLEVRKKVDENEVISKINQSAESIGINANKIDLSANDILNLLAGNTINVSSKKIKISSDNFKLDEYGNMNCNSASVKNANIEGGNLRMWGNTTLDGVRVFSDSSKNSQYMAYMVSDSIGVNNGNDSAAMTPTVINIGSSSIYKDHITTPSLTQTSLKENKKNLEKLQDNALDILKKIDIYKYNLKDEKDTDKKHIGFIIGDGYNYSKEVTSIDNKGVDNYSFTSLCCKAIQEQQETIKQLQLKIEKIEKGE